MWVQTSNTLTTNAVEMRVSSMWNLIRLRKLLGIERCNVGADCRRDVEPSRNSRAEVGLHRSAYRRLGHRQVVVLQRFVDVVLPQAELPTEVELDFDQVGHELGDAPAIWLDDLPTVGVCERRP